MDAIAMKTFAKPFRLPDMPMDEYPLSGYMPAEINIEAAGIAERM
jgi:hypothetical protein